MEYLLTTHHLTKTYGRHKAVDGVSLHLRQGDIYGLIGRNGAGKTTLLKLLSGLAAPTAGDFTLFGATGRHARAYLSRVGTLIEAPGIYPNLSAAENLKLKCLALGVRRRNAASDLLDTVGLARTGRKPVRHFSLGMKQRLGIALALVGDPDLLILDEPINGLDPQGIAEVRETLYHLNRDRNITLILASHILEVPRLPPTTASSTTGPCSRSSPGRSCWKSAASASSSRPATPAGPAPCWRVWALPSTKWWTGTPSASMSASTTAGPSPWPWPRRGCRPPASPCRMKHWRTTT